MAQAPSEDVDLGFDQLLDRLRDIVARLEEGNLGLEESLVAYEQGVSLARRAHAQLDHAERRVEILSADGSAEPLDVGDDEDDDDDEALSE